jgi:acetoacetyl-CoA synthetase
MSQVPAVTSFAHWCARHRGAPAGDEYLPLHKWSVENLSTFWTAVWDYFEVRSSTGYGAGSVQERMPGARWFPGSRLNYVTQVFAAAHDDAPAIIDVTEGAIGSPRLYSWQELRERTAALAATLRRLGVLPGDRVVGYLPNTAEAVIAFLATASLGAVWSSCGQDYAPAAAGDRFAQLEPVVLITADGYRYGGKDHDRREAVAALRALLPTVTVTIAVDRVGLPIPGALTWEQATSGTPELRPAEVAFDHPLWILFSSGTTGVPKGLVHGHGGVVLEHLKALALHLDLGPRDTYFWYTSPSWMVWNYLVSGLLVGSSIVCFDGSPSPATLWEIAAAHHVTLLGASPGYLLANAKAGLRPGRDHDLSWLRTLGSSGSALPAESYRWVADNVGEGVRVVSTSGGTDIVSAFAGGVATVPIVPGELSAPCLGVALDAWDAQGRSMRDSVGELVVTKPMPSMPLYLWNDPDGNRYRETYFSTYPGVWRHGDWITITGRESVIVHGRSDSTLNRNGVRLGSADIYQVVEKLPEIAEALIIGAEQPDGGYWMPLFVVLRDGTVLDDTLTRRIRDAIRDNASPRHLPDEILAVQAIPHTRTGKKLEVPVKKLLQGAGLGQVADSKAVDDPAALAFFADYHTRRSGQHGAKLPDPDHGPVLHDDGLRQASR